MPAAGFEVTIILSNQYIRNRPTTMATDHFLDDSVARGGDSGRVDDRHRQAETTRKVKK